MDTLAYARVALIYAHLLVCVFALHDVLATDWQLLRGTMRADQLAAVRVRVLRLLIGLWLTGLAVAALDLRMDFSLLAAKPKLLTKLTVVIALTANGWALNRWVFPLLDRGVPLDAKALRVALGSGALSTFSWLFAAFLGVAKPLAQWPVSQLLVMYTVLALLSIAAGAVVGQLLAQRRWAGLGAPMPLFGAWAGPSVPVMPSVDEDQESPPHRLAA